ncbi:unnamed protein product [Linum trigynum]|uniref:Retrotransposon Copia-like N-terminal domain-containing protein n=1 Tax=Linum trigynum TaxID=586398 RepID=A0AAV2CDB3_9ROSI
MGDTSASTVSSAVVQSNGGAGTGDVVIGGRYETDPASPYFLSQSDNPNQMYVGELLNETNYADWVYEMTTSLLAKNKLGFVDGSLAAPIDPGKLCAYRRTDAMVNGR